MSKIDITNQINLAVQAAIDRLFEQAVNDNREIQILYFLLDAGADPYGCDMKLLRPTPGYAPMHHIASTGRSTTMKKIVDRGWILDRRDAAGYNALHYAVKHQKSDVVKVLVEGGCDVNVASPEGTALHMAVDNCRSSIVELLKASNIRPNMKRDCDGFTALHIACFRACCTSDVLGLHGVDVDARDNNYNTPLHIACKYGHYSTVNMLLGHSPDLDAINSDGLKPSQLARKEGHFKLAEHLETLETMPKKEQDEESSEASSDMEDDQQDHFTVIDHYNIDGVQKWCQENGYIIGKNI